jgi:HSP20 family molecular chaperone IbpA
MSKYDLFSGDWLSEMVESFDSLFKGLKLDGIKDGETTTKVTSVSRSYHASVNDKEMVITVELPGILPHMVTAQYTGQTLMVEYQHNGKNHVQKYTIRPEFNIDDVSATLALGVLTLKLRRREVPQGKKIDIGLG